MTKQRKRRPHDDKMVLGTPSVPSFSFAGALGGRHLVCGRLRLYANIGFSDAIPLKAEEIESMEICTGLGDAKYETHDTAYIAQVLEELDAFRFHRRSRSPLHRVGDGAILWILP